jgi:hypothetical protein
MHLWETRTSRLDENGMPSRRWAGACGGQPGGAPVVMMLVSGFLGASVYGGISMVFRLYGMVGLLDARWTNALAPLLVRLALLGGAVVASVATAALAWGGWAYRKEEVGQGDFSGNAFWLIIIAISAAVSFLTWRLFLTPKQLQPSNLTKKTLP